MQAVGQVVDALVLQIEQPGAAAESAVSAAVKHWEAACGGSMEASTLDRLREDAQDLVKRRQGMPPPIESVLADAADHPGISDVGYELGLDAGGLRGTWHRLFMAIAMGRVFGDTPEQRARVTGVRGELEQLLGRQMSPSEWDALERRALPHGERLAKKFEQRERRD